MVRAHHDEIDFSVLRRAQNRRGRIADAVSAYKEVVKRNPKDPGGLTAVASGLLTLGHLDDARAQLAQIDNALVVSPRLPPQLQAQLDTVRSSVRRQTESGRAE